MTDPKQTFIELCQALEEQLKDNQEFPILFEVLLYSDDGMYYALSRNDTNQLANILTDVSPSGDISALIKMLQDSSLIPNSIIIRTTSSQDRPRGPITDLDINGYTVMSMMTQIVYFRTGEVVQSGIITIKGKEGNTSSVYTIEDRRRNGTIDKDSSIILFSGEGSNGGFIKLESTKTALAVYNAFGFTGISEEVSFGNDA